MEIKRTVFLILSLVLSFYWNVHSASKYVVSFNDDGDLDFCIFSVETLGLRTYLLR